MMDSAAVWVINYADVSPAFVAARAGYDVWLGNNRGNIFSNSHIKLDKTMALYWNFDWQEMGEFDIPATFDYITETTGYEKIAYIGYSQGTTQLFYGLTILPEYYRAKLSVFVALAPVTRISHSPTTLLKVTNVFYEFIDSWFLTRNIFDLAPTPEIIKPICDTLPSICMYASTFLFGSTT